MKPKLFFFGSINRHQASLRPQLMTMSSSFNEVDDDEKGVGSEVGLIAKDYRGPGFIEDSRCDFGKGC